MWSRRLLAFLALSAVAPGAIVDRIALVAGNHPIKDSEIERDIRITSFLNGVRPDFSGPVKRATAGRLVDQLLIRNEIAKAAFPAAAPAAVEGALAKIKRIRFPGGEADYRKALTGYGVAEQDLKAQLLWQLTVLRFIEVKFRGAGPAQVASAKEAMAAEERANAKFFGWLDVSRQALRVHYRDEVFQ